MSRFFEIAKAHPWWIAGGVLAVVVLIWLMSRGGSASSPGIIAYGPSDATVAANAAIEAARIEANAAVSGAQLNNEITSKLADVQLAGLVNSNAAAVVINEQNVKGAVDITTAETIAAVQLANLEKDVMFKEMETSLTALLNNNVTDIQLAAINTGKKVVMNTKPARPGFEGGTVSLKFWQYPD